MMVHMLKKLGVAALIVALAACQQQPKQQSALPGEVKIGKPYVIDGKTYYPEYDPVYDKVGEASWYGPGFHGKYTANGEIFNQDDLTAAHPTLPMPSLVRVTNMVTGKSLVVRINDRGPFKNNRIIDLSKASAQRLGINGIKQVRVQFLKDETAEYLTNRSKGKPIDMFALNEQLSGKWRDNPAMVASTTTEAPVSAVKTTDITPPATAVAVSAAPQAGHSPDAPSSQSSLIREVWAEDTVSAQAQVDRSQPYSPPAAVDASVTEAKVASASPSSGGRLIIQAGSFSAEQNAHKLSSQLSTIAEVAVDRVVVGDKTWYRVRLGPFSDQQSAEEALGKVHSAGVPDARIVRKI